MLLPQRRWLAEVLLGERPVGELVQPGLDVVRPAVLVVEVVGVLPHVGDQQQVAKGVSAQGGLKALLKSSTLPKLSSRAFLILPAGAPPLGAMLCQ